jgi:hypothetical protein
MEPKDLPKLWGSPDNSRLTKKQYSLRFPFHVMAKVNAIGEMYPSKTKTEIIGDLLASALEQFAAGLPDEADELEVARGRDPMREYCGQRRWYEETVQRNKEALEKEERDGEPVEAGDASQVKEGKGMGKTGPDKRRGARAPRGKARA